ncbi:MAG: VCBS repeat-containing protein [Deltaproteobacteria bacterium]|nr:VCBS repeat-containing protein [Deltaproteobacteria bacterium]
MKNMPDLKDMQDVSSAMVAGVLRLLGMSLALTCCVPGVSDLEAQATGDDAIGAASVGATDLNLLVDPGFTRGLRVLAPGSSFNAIPTPSGSLCPPSSCSPAWELAQWGSSTDVSGGGLALKEGRYTWSTATKEVAFGSGVLALKVNSDAEFGGRYKAAGADWPHLLVGQAISEPGAPGLGSPWVSDMSSLDFSIEARLVQATRVEGGSGYDPSIHAAQFLIYFTIQDLSAPYEGSGHDFLWLGIVAYDDRDEFPLGGADGTDTGQSKLMYKVPLRKLTKTSLRGGDWVSIRGNLLPFVRKAIKVAKQRGLLASSDLARFRVGKVTMGWEVPGRHIVEMHVRGFSLQARASVRGRISVVDGAPVAFQTTHMKSDTQAEFLVRTASGRLHHFGVGSDSDHAFVNPPEDTLLYSESNASWRVLASADFDGEGTDDILWTNSVTGQVFMMLMDDTGIVSEQLVYHEPNLAWQIVGVADFDGDRRADILWRNNQTGDVYMMLMGGFTILSQQTVYREPNTAWTIVALGDFDGDGRSDVLWRNAATGQVYMMMMHGLSVVGGAQIYSEPNNAWRIVSAQDFDADGRADILWHNGTTGEVYVMCMNGFSIARQAMAYREPNLFVQIVGTRDFNRDGRADLLWYNAQTRRVLGMAMNGVEAGPVLFGIDM